jgi:hypothetical protein
MSMLLYKYLCACVHVCVCVCVCAWGKEKRERESCANKSVEECKHMQLCPVVTCDVNFSLRHHCLLFWSIMIFLKKGCPSKNSIFCICFFFISSVFKCFSVYIHEYLFCIKNNFLLIFSMWCGQCVVLAGESVNLAAGFGFNGYTSTGEPRWDMLDNVSLWDVEVISFYCIYFSVFMMCL